MKKIYALCILLGFAITPGFSQNFPIDDGTGKITYIKTVEAPSMTAAEIYKATKDWAKEQ
ncbi:MAG: hypothetical protein HRT68_17050, partial [Flavobacteriaceae bacterium]|nr:hypothetical protein [Flavobacteriaceae bacterium]